MREILAGNISRYRKELGLTQEALGEKLGVSFQAVSKWETNQIYDLVKGILALLYYMEGEFINVKYKC